MRLIWILLFCEVAAVLAMWIIDRIEQYKLAKARQKAKDFYRKNKAVLDTERSEHEQDDS